MQSVALSRLLVGVNSDEVQKIQQLDLNIVTVSDRDERRGRSRTRPGLDDGVFHAAVHRRADQRPGHGHGDRGREIIAAHRSDSRRRHRERVHDRKNSRRARLRSDPAWHLDPCGGRRDRSRLARPGDRFRNVRLRPVNGAEHTGDLLFRRVLLARLPVVLPCCSRWSRSPAPAQRSSVSR